MDRRVGAAALAVAAAVAGCGDDEDDSGGDAERYCELAAELDEAGTEVFAPLEEDESATDEDYARVEQEFLEAHQDDFDELRQAAPEEIADEIAIVLAAQEERAAGGEQEETSDEAATAEEQVLDFEEQNCSGE